MNRLAVFLKDKDKKSYPVIITELIQLLVAKGELPRHYLGKYLYRKDIKNPGDYLSMGEFYKILHHPKLHNPDNRTLLRNKLIFSLFCEKYKVPTPALLGHNLNGVFVTGDNEDHITNLKELKVFFKKLMQESKQEGIFIKAVSEMGGAGCYRIMSHSLDEHVESLYPKILKSAFIHQKLVKQHPHIDAIYAGSVNTLRLDSYIDNTGKTHILSALMRFGSGGGFVDNGSAGGLQVGIEMQEGRLKARANAQMKRGLPFLYEHPDTHFKFEGFKIPYFKESCDLIKRAVNLIPDRLTGWDVAITEKGPLLIEGNDNPSIHLTDINYNGYLRHPLFKEIMDIASS